MPVGTSAAGSVGEAGIVPVREAVVTGWRVVADLLVMVAAAFPVSVVPTRSIAGPSTAARASNTVRCRIVVGRMVTMLAPGPPSRRGAQMALGMVRCSPHVTQEIRSSSIGCGVLRMPFSGSVGSSPWCPTAGRRSRRWHPCAHPTRGKGDRQVTTRCPPARSRRRVRRPQG